MGKDKEQYKAIVAFTFYENRTNVGGDFVQFLEREYKAMFLDESTYGIPECDVDKLIDGIKKFLLAELSGKYFNYKSEDFIRIFHAFECFVSMSELKPFDIQKEAAINDLEYNKELREDKAQINYRN